MASEGIGQLEPLWSAIGVTVEEVIVLKDDGGVFRAKRGSSDLIVKVYSRKRAFDVEEEVLRSLNARGAPVPRLVASHSLEPRSVAIFAPSPGAPLESLMPGMNAPNRARAMRMVGRTVATCQLAIPEEELRRMQFWRRFDGTPTTWAPTLSTRLAKWLERIDRSTIPDRPQQTIAQLQKSVCLVPEPWRMCLIHGDLGLRNLLYHPEAGAMTLLDFETAFVGDPAYDLAKMVWNLDGPDGGLMAELHDAWSEITGRPVDVALQNRYECIQAVAAIAWTDAKERDRPGSGERHREFRQRALSRLEAGLR